jgi:hypothetical protein
MPLKGLGELLTLPFMETVGPDASRQAATSRDRPRRAPSCPQPARQSHGGGVIILEWAPRQL